MDNEIRRDRGMVFPPPSRQMGKQGFAARSIYFIRKRATHERLSDISLFVHTPVYTTASDESLHTYSYSKKGQKVHSARSCLPSPQVVHVQNIMSGRREGGQSVVAGWCSRSVPGLLRCLPYGLSSFFTLYDIGAPCTASWFIKGFWVRT